MKMKYITLIAAIGLLFTGCEYDNYDEPNATLNGRVVYNGNPVGVRIDGARLELWQDGYADKKKIDVYIGQDGHYSAALFNGQYKLVRVAGAPWEAQSSDTTVIDVKGQTVRDIEVKPFMVINNESFRKNGSNVEANFTVDRIVDAAKLEEVKLYFSKNMLLDNNNNDGAVSIDISSIVLGSGTSFTAQVPASLASRDVFVKLGVRSDKSNEFYYTQAQKLQ